MSVLLGIFMLMYAAHADESMEISLHNEDALAELSIVRNWTLICEQLCSLNLSGPACGPECSSADIPVGLHESSEVENIEEYNFPLEHQSELCETLCDNGLGGNRCICPIKIIPAASSSAMRSSDRNRICSDFCRYHRVTLRGCKRCDFDIMVIKKPLKNNAGYYPPPPPLPPPFQPHRMENVLWQSPSFDARDNNAEQPFQASTAAPTPDWGLLCASLCRQGTGGILCNCDLAPF